MDFISKVSGYLVCVLLAMQLAACGGSGDDNGNDGNRGGYFAISSKSKPDYCVRSVDDCYLEIEGPVFDEYFGGSGGGRCSFLPPYDIPGDPGVSVTWHNASNNTRGEAFVWWRWEAPFYSAPGWCEAYWETSSVKLSPGANEVTFTATGISGRSARIERRLKVKATNWTAPEEFGWYLGTTPDIAIAEDGGAASVWQNWGEIWTRQYGEDTGWQSPERLDNASGRASDPSIASLGSGEYIAVWSQIDNSSVGIWFRHYRPGAGWSPASRVIGVAGTGTAVSLQIASDGMGNAVSTWLREGAFGKTIQAARYLTGSGWGTVDRIDSDSEAAGEPRLAVDSIGNAVVVWRQADSIWSNYYSVVSGWGLAQPIEGESGSVTLPRIAIDASGNAIAVWTQSDGARFGVRANRYQVHVGWLGTETIEGGSHDARTADVGVDADGNAIVVWSQSDTRRSGVWSTRYRVDSGWKQAKRVAGRFSLNPRIAVAANGDAALIWREGAYSNEVNLLSYSVKNGWHNTRMYSGDSGINQIRLDRPPVVTTGPNGQFQALWVDTDYVMGSRIVR